MTGPVIVGVIAVTAGPALGLLLSARLAVGGTALFLRSPLLASWSAPPEPQAGSGGPGPEPGSNRVILPLALATGAIGLCLGGLGLVIVAFC